MAFVGKKPESNIWEEICKEFASMRPPFHKDDDCELVATEISGYNPSWQVNANVMEDFDPSKSQPAHIGVTMLKKPTDVHETPPPPPAPPKDVYTPREYLEHYIFPVLLPALLAMLKMAKKERCYERKRFRFNGCDFLTEYLWRHNLNHPQRIKDDLEDIPFVRRILKENPRPPLPLSLVWSEEEAAIIIQSFWRGYEVRKTEEVQELRVWQREWREENADIKRKVDDFWKEHEPGPDQDDLRKSARLRRSAGYPACRRLRTWSPEAETQ